MWFLFQQTKFVYSDAGGKPGFVRLEYPSEGSFQAYLACRGLRDEADLAAAKERWGPNVLDIPMPPFMKLFAEHAVAPFFVFQARTRMLMFRTSARPLFFLSRETARGVEVVFFSSQGKRRWRFDNHRRREVAVPSHALVGPRRDSRIVVFA